MSEQTQSKALDVTSKQSENTTQTEQLTSTPHKQKSKLLSQVIPDDGQQANYKNQFMNISVAKHQPFPHVPESKKILTKPYKIQRQSKNRSRTQPKQTIKVNLQQKKKTLFPQLSTNLVEVQNKKEKVMKLRQLYQRKSKLFKKLEQINREFINIKYQSQELVSRQQAVQQIKSGQQTSLSRKSPSNRKNSYHFHYSRYLLNNKKKDPSPQSMISPQKNREVLSFIKKMHQQSIKRDLNRFEYSKKVIENQIKHVCMECSRQKCQDDAVGRILRQSRVE